MKYPSPDLALYKALLQSYSHCLKNKRHVKKKSFHLTFERTVHQLALDIENRTYRPGVSNIFVVTHPKPREVIAANLRDRIVHHFIYDYMAPYWERRFVPNSYACRVDKGPLRAGRDLRQFVRSHYQHGGAPLYYLQLDIQNFFSTIDLNVLCRLVEKHLENPLYSWLVKTVLFHRATHKGNFVLTSPKSLWKMLPRYKSLFYTPDHIGLPIGNLTSQFFANVYMNHFDQFVAHALKGRFLYWQRYVDDILFLGDDRQALSSLIPLVEDFLRRELHLTINRKKTLLQPLAHGLDHLGYWYKPDYQTVRRRVANNCRQKLREIALTPASDINADEVCSTLNSYLGYFANAYSKGLREEVAERVNATVSLAGKVVADKEGKKVVRAGDAERRQDRVRRERELQREFVEAFPVGAAVATDADEQNERKRSKRLVAAYVKRWRPMTDILEAAGEHFRDSPARIVGRLTPFFNRPLS